MIEIDDDSQKMHVSTDGCHAQIELKAETDNLQDIRIRFGKISQENGHFPAVVGTRKQ
jgi:hypothetical protein